MSLFKTELYFSKPLMNAAGTLGFAPPSRVPFDLEEFGAFITNPVSMAPRAPAQSRAYLPFTGGFLLHSGYPNPGFKNVLRRFAPRWARSSLPVIVHLLAQEMREVAVMAERLESQEGIMGLELGLPPGTDEDQTYVLVSSAVGELPVIAQLPAGAAPSIAEAAIEAGAAALSISPHRGVLSNPNGGSTSGRLYGPSLFPHVMLTLRLLLDYNVPVIAAGGIYNAKQVNEALSAGAAAVKLDGLLWRGGWQGSI